MASCMGKQLGKYKLTHKVNSDYVLSIDLNFRLFPFIGVLHICFQPFFPLKTLIKFLSPPFMKIDDLCEHIIKASRALEGTSGSPDA